MLPGTIYRYGVLDSITYTDREQSKKKTRPNTVSLGILNMMLPLPIIVPIHTCLFLINRLMRNAKRKRKKKKDTVGNEIIPFVPSLTENGEIY